MSDKTIEVHVMETLEHYKTIKIPMVCPKCGADFSLERVAAWEADVVAFRYRPVEQEGKYVLDPDTATVAGDFGGESMAVSYSCGRCDHILHASNERRLSDDEWDVATMAIALLATEPAPGATKAVCSGARQVQAPPEPMRVVIVREHGKLPEATLCSESQVSQEIVRVAREMSGRYSSEYSSLAAVENFARWLQKGSGHMLEELWDDRFLGRVRLEVLAVAPTGNHMLKGLTSGSEVKDESDGGR